MDITANISKYPKLDSLIEKLIERLNADWSKLFDHKIALEMNKIEIVLTRHIMSKMADSNVLVENVIDFGGKSLESFYLLFPYEGAIMVCGNLLKHEREKIQEFFSASNISKEYINTFVKFIKQANDSFDNVFQALLDKNPNASFSQYLISPKDNDKLEVIFPLSDDQVICNINLQYSLPQFGKAKFDLLFPLELLEEFCGETIRFSKNMANGTILVLDDSKSDIAVIRRFLRNRDYQIIEGKDEQSALYQMSSGKIDLILINTDIEINNGISICKGIRRNMGYHHIPIIMLSSNPNKEDIVNSLKAGAQDFIVKPFKKEVLQPKIIKRMSSRRK